MMLLVLLYAPEFWSAAAEDSTGCTTTTLGLALPLTVAVWESGDKQAIKNCTCIPDYAFSEYNSTSTFNLRDISNIFTVGVQAFSNFHGTLIFGSKGKHGKGAPLLRSIGVSCFVLCDHIPSACIFSCR